MSTTPQIPINPWDRLRQERERLGLTQTQFGAKGGVQKWAQIKYEKGVRKPDSKYLEGIAAAGADVAYILTGQPERLRYTLNNVKLATEVAGRIGGSPEEMSENQERIFQGLQTVQTHQAEETELLSDYRRCDPPDQIVIRKMAKSLARDAPAESPKKKPRKKT